jgi:hypothetical protein
MRKFVLVGLLALVAGLVFQAPAEARHPVKSFALPECLRCGQGQCRGPEVGVTASMNEFHWRVLAVGVGLALALITLVILLSHVSPWWAAPSAFLGIGWWSTLIKAWITLLLEPGDAYRHRPE